ncbi:hypothetical protein GWL_05060 [Herbaspirillum sp. GW103]|nr:hypothetical protein GWL_05060 [Herbaspirillum sp. GW103]
MGVMSVFLLAHEMPHDKSSTTKTTGLLCRLRFADPSGEQTACWSRHTPRNIDTRAGARRGNARTAREPCAPAVPCLTDRVRPAGRRYP